MAVYDDNLSEDVSLSRILDEFIVSGERSEVVVNFLKTYDTEFKDIAGQSIYIDRIYFIGYLKDCKLSESKYLLSHLCDIDELTAMNCVWQIMKSDLRTILLPYTQEFRSSDMSKFLKHPYSGFGHSKLTAFDDEIISGFMPEIVFDSYSPENLHEILSNIKNSLVAARILQYDVFECCSLKAKWQMIHDQAHYPLKMKAKFFKQLFVSAAPNEKFEAWFVLFDGFKTYYDASNDLVKAFYPTLYGKNDVLSKLSNANSYAPIAMMLMLNGEEIIADSIFFLLMSGRFHILYEMDIKDKKKIEDNFPISDLIAYMNSNTCAIERSLKNGKCN